MENERLFLLVLSNGQTMAVNQEQYQKFLEERDEQ